MYHKYFSFPKIILALFMFNVVILFDTFSQDTIRYYQDNKLVEEIYLGEEDKLPKFTVAPRVAFGFQSLSPAVYPTRLLASRFWSVGGQYRRLLLPKQNISVGLGLELAWNNLGWQGDDFLSKNQDSVSFVNINAEKVHKNKLGILNLSVPIIFYKVFEKNWRIGLGAYTDWRLQSSSRVAYTMNNENINTKNFSDFHLQSMRYGLQVEIKYKFLRIFSKYDINSLFKPEKAEKTNIWTFGIGF